MIRDFTRDTYGPSGFALVHGPEPNITQAMPKFLNKSLKPRLPIQPEHVAIGPGIGAILAHLIWHLCDKEEGVVLTAVLSLLF